MNRRTKLAIAALVTALAAMIGGAAPAEAGSMPPQGRPTVCC
jgi:hypothetical protein